MKKIRNEENKNQLKNSQGMKSELYFDLVDRVHDLDGLAEDLTEAVCAYNELRDMLKIVESKEEEDHDEQSEIPLCTKYLLQHTTMFQMLAAKIDGIKDLILEETKKIEDYITETF